MITARWSKGITRALPLWLSLALCLLAPALVSASQWAQSTVDTNTAAGRYVSLAVGSDGKLHMSYLRGSSSYNLHYATGLSGSWSLSASLFTGTRVLAGTSIDVDSLNLPHVAFYVDGGSNKLYTIQKSDATTWAAPVSMDNVTPAADSSNSLFMHKSGTHISYYDNHLSFANYSGGSKTLKTVDTSSTAGKYNAAAVDSSGKFHIVYFDTGTNRLMYAYGNTVSGSWSKAVIPTVPQYAGGYCALAIDRHDNLHVSYVDATDYPNNRVKYVTLPLNGDWSAPADIGPSWVSGTKSGFTSIAVDSADFAHISYYGSTAKLMYATNMGGGWTTEAVPADAGSTDYGMYSSIKVDGNDNVYIAYYDVNKSRLKVAAKQVAGIAVSPATLDFGSVSRVGASSQSVTLANNGTADLVISSITLAGASAAEFSAGSCGTIIPDGNCTVTVTLTPGSGGAKAAALVINSNAPYDPAASVALSGSSPWLITANVGNGGTGGSITPAGPVNVAPGASQSFSFAPAGTPFSLSDVLVDNVSVGAAGSYLFSNVSADHSIESLFVSPIRLFGIPYLYFGSLQGAYDAIAGSGTVQSQTAIPAGEELLIDKPVVATLKGGYGADFSGQSGDTTLRGITISDGNLTPEGLVLQ